jgi:hypothetical protein
MLDHALAANTLHKTCSAMHACTHSAICISQNGARQFNHAFCSSTQGHTHDTAGESPCNDCVKTHSNARHTHALELKPHTGNTTWLFTNQCNKPLCKAFQGSIWNVGGFNPTQGLSKPKRGMSMHSIPRATCQHAAPLLLLSFKQQLLQQA